MTHWKSMMDRDFIYAFDLGGKDVTVTIASVKAGQLTGQGGRKAKKPVIYFAGKEKGLAANATNCKVIAKMYGNDIEEWTGKRITLYATTTEMNGETVECIRVRPRIPSGTNKGKPSGPDQASLPEPDDDEPTGDPEPPEPGSSG